MDARVRACLAVGAVAGALLCAPASAPAAPASSAAKTKAAKPTPVRTRRVAPLPQERLANLGATLLGGDSAAAVAAAQELGGSGAPNAADPLIEALALGTWPEVAQAAILALGRLRESRAVPLLTLYAGNRNEVTRTAAVTALAQIPDDRAAGALFERLGDASPKVRAAAAAGLAERKDRRAVNRLTKLFARGDEAAAAALGALAPADAVPGLAELQGRVSDDTFVALLGEVLKREDVPDPLRVDVVDLLAKIPGVVATAALAEYLATAPADGRPSLGAAQRVMDDRGRTP